MIASPEVVEFVEEIDGFHFRSILLPANGMVCGQHKHDISHPTLCGSGKAKLYVEGFEVGDVEAGHAIHVEAGKEHFFVALEDNTRLTCVFNAEQALALKAEGH